MFYFPLCSVALPVRTKMESFPELQAVASDLRRMKIEFDNKLQKRYLESFLLGFIGAFPLVEALSPILHIWSLIVFPIGFTWVIVVLFLGHRIFNKKLREAIEDKTKEYYEEISQILVEKGADRNSIEFEKQKDYEFICVNMTINNTRRRIKIIHHLKSQI